MAITVVPWALTTLGASGAEAAPGNDTLLFGIGAAVVVATAFAAGCIYQWYRQALERDLAWRDGYDKASQSLFRLAANVRHTCQRKPEPVAKAAGVAAVVALPTQADRHSRGDGPGQGRRAMTDRFERTTVQLLRQPGTPACRSGDDPTAAVRSA